MLNCVSDCKAGTAHESCILSMVTVFLLISEKMNENGLDKLMGDIAHTCQRYKSDDSPSFMVLNYIFNLHHSIFTHCIMSCDVAYVLYYGPLTLLYWHCLVTIKFPIILQDIIVLFIAI